MIELVHKGQIKSWTRLWLTLLRTYFRVEVIGINNVPRRGAAIIAPNHSGFVGADAVLLTFILKRETKRRARILAHRAYFDFLSTLKSMAESFGLRRASISTGVEVLKQNHLLILFPEGEAGNFKSSLKRYQLQDFHTGFLRMALEAQTPIIPCLICGAEETHLNWGNVDLSRWIKGLRIPFPINWVPLPSKWKIVFLPPIDVKKNQDLKKQAKKIQSQMQKLLNQELKSRPYIYFKATRALWNKILGKPNQKSSKRRQKQSRKSKTSE